MSSPDRSDDDFGARMRRAREGHGVSLRQIAETTKLSVRALEALERNDISLLPGGIFSRAFVRAYASEVGMDPEQTVREFMVRFPHDSVTIGSPHVPPDLDTAGEGRRRRRGIVAMLLAIIVIVAAGALYVMSRQ